MAWIESHQELAHHPKTKKLARLLGVEVPTAIGYLHLLWWWATSYAQDGDLSRYEAGDIADAMLYGGDADALLAALVQAGFLEADHAIHDWDTYAGKLIEKRRKDAGRKRDERATSKEEDAPSNGHPADIQRTAQVPNRTKPDRTVPDQPGATNGALAVAAHAPSEPVPKDVPRSHLRAVPKPERQLNRYGQVLEAIKAIDADVVVGGIASRNGKACRESDAPPELIAEAYVAMTRGEWADPFVSRQGSLHAVVDNIGGYLNGQREAKHGKANGRSALPERGTTQRRHI